MEHRVRLSRQASLAGDDDGFTLIELLVVIIIIGVLAAIAIPTFLGQRQRGYDAAAKSDLRNLANFEELYLNDTDRYGTIAEVQAIEPRMMVTKDVTLSVIVYQSNLGYCLSAQRAGSTTTWYYDSQGGGMQPKGAPGCPVTTTGVSGDTVTG